MKKARRAAKLCFHKVDPFLHFVKCIGNPIVKKMALRNINFLFFEPPDASIFTKIGSDLAHIRFYTDEWHIFDILGFLFFWGGLKEPNLIENQPFRPKSTNFWCSKKFSRPPGSWFITKMAMNLYFSNIYKSILGIFFGQNRLFQTPKHSYKSKSQESPK